MAQTIAVATSVSAVLTNENWWPPRHLEAVMGGSYHYDNGTMTNFLIKVRHLMETGIGERFTFTFDDAFVTQAIGYKVATLIGAIDARSRRL